MVGQNGTSFVTIAARWHGILRVIGVATAQEGFKRREEKNELKKESRKALKSQRRRWHGAETAPRGGTKMKGNRSSIFCSFISKAVSFSLSEGKTIPSAYDALRCLQGSCTQCDAAAVWGSCLPACGRSATASCATVRCCAVRGINISRCSVRFERTDHAIKMQARLPLELSLAARTR